MRRARRSGRLDGRGGRSERARRARAHRSPPARAPSPAGQRCACGGPLCARRGRRARTPAARPRARPWLMRPRRPRPRQPRACCVAKKRRHGPALHFTHPRPRGQARPRRRCARWWWWREVRCGAPGRSRAVPVRVRDFGRILSSPTRNLVCDPHHARTLCKPRRCSARDAFFRGRRRACSACGPVPQAARLQARGAPRRLGPGGGGGGGGDGAGAAGGHAVDGGVPGQGEQATGALAVRSPRAAREPPRAPPRSPSRRLVAHARCGGP